MNKLLKARNGLVFPTNVRIIQKSTDGSIIKDTSVKNMVLKQYGLYSYVRFILGSFQNGNIYDKQQYVPKYLAVGSNQAPLTGAPGTDTAVQITDISLYHEINDDGVTGEDNNRIKLNRANYIEDDISQPNLTIQYEAYIPEDRFVNQTIGELALMTDKTGWNAYARITGFSPIVKAPNTVIQIIWSITIISVESSDRFIPPIKTYLREAIEKAINVLQVDKNDPDNLSGARVALDKLIQPATTEGTGLYYLLNENEMITQDVINNYLSKPFISLDNCGLISLIHMFPSGKDWLPSNSNWNVT